MKRTNFFILPLCVLTLLTACTEHASKISNIDQAVISSGSTELSEASSKQDINLTSTPGLPKMTEQNQKYYEQYLEPIIYTGLLYRTFGPEDFSQLGQLVDEQGQVIGSCTLWFCFEDLCGDQKWADALNTYQQPDGSVLIPQEMPEEVLLKYFPLTPDEIRNLLNCFYQPEQKAYLIYPGRGGGPVYSVVKNHRVLNEVLELDYTVYGWDGDSGSAQPRFSGTLQIKDSKYWSNRIDE